MRVGNVEYRREISNQNFGAKKVVKFNRRLRKHFPKLVEEITSTLDNNPTFKRFCELYDVRMNVKLGLNVGFPFCPRNARKQCRIWYNADMMQNNQSLNILDRLKDGYFGIVLGKGSDTLEKAAESLSDSLKDGSSKFYRVIGNLIDIATAKRK